ncbi:DUF6432 family protein [Haloarchaeobius sp. HME9146]|uniref:DUF6432 family protein n=1 Tax=Haloarchaeobius sp. HME9146 TaxID=2978732 RepID=UPI0021BF571B|nr:DUF6432 family protein [Haloarchaeobius sp. HME9146]MCT9095385.1 DUF6432 family protein [Haloarchaeobius sp. HME9146]
MKAKREFRNRADIDVSVLDALVDRADDGMTVFELRSHVEADIDDLETALAGLKEDGLIVVEQSTGRTVIKPADQVIPDPEDLAEDPSLIDELRKKLPF